MATVPWRSAVFKMRQYAFLAHQSCNVRGRHRQHIERVIAMIHVNATAREPQELAVACTLTDEVVVHS